MVASALLAIVKPSMPVDVGVARSSTSHPTMRVTIMAGCRKMRRQRGWSVRRCTCNLCRLRCRAKPGAKPVGPAGPICFCMARELSADDVRKVASLARLSLREEEVEQMRTSLGAVLAYMERLQAVDTRGVEPLYNVNDGVAELRGDEPGPALRNEQLMGIAPHPRDASTHPPFIRVPKVIDEGGGA